MNARWLLLATAASLAVVVLADAARAGDSEAVGRARAEQDRNIKSTLARGGQSALDRLVEREVLRAEQTGRSVDLYLAGRILCATAENDDEGRKRQRRGFEYFRRALRADPSLWHARMAMALVWLEADRLDDARVAIDQVRTQVPQELEPLRVAIEVRLRQKAYSDAIALLTELQAREPDNAGLLATLGELNLLSERADEAFGWFTRLKATEAYASEPRWAVQYAQSAMATGHGDVAVRELVALRGSSFWIAQPEVQRMLLEVLLATKAAPATLRREVESYLQRAPEDPMWRAIAVDLAIDAGDIRTARIHLEAVLPHVKEGPERERALSLLELLKQGFDPRQGPPRPLGPEPPPPVPVESPFAELLKRCLAEDVETRRAALQEYLDLDLAVLDMVVYIRVHPDVEPDPTCRLLVARILGAFDAASAAEPVISYTAAKHLAHAMNDPDATVRAVAAEELGGMGVPSALLYLRLYVQAIDLSPTEDEARRKDAAREYNAARLALVALTGRQDLPVSAPRWVPFEQAEAHRDGWTAWFDGPEGTRAIVAALDDLDRAVRVEKPPFGPARWCHHFAFSLCFQPWPREVALRAYRVLRDALPPTIGAAEETVDPRHARLFADFPRWSDEELASMSAIAVDSGLRTWWRGHVPTVAGK